MAMTLPELAEAGLLDPGWAGALAPVAPDIAALAVEFGTASFRMSYFLHGEITDDYAQAGADAMIGFLTRRLALD